jgi:Ser/Thr protein kinase RdoA (MazF antagonist)
MLRSLLDPATVASLVTGAYGMPVSRCVLLRTLVNDVYRVETPAGPLALKIYGPGRDRDAAWEAGLAAQVADAGVDLARAVRLADGAWAGEVALAEGPRQYTLWEWAPGAHAPQPFDDELYRRFGVAVAGFHAAAGEAPAGPATPVAAHLDQVLDRVEAGDRAVIRALVVAARRHLDDAGQALDRGICHGDVSMDNVHVDGDRLILFDLDLDLDLAGVDWRAADLAGVGTTPYWPAFLAGYRSVRPFPDRDVAAMPWLQVLQRVEHLHFHLVRKSAFRGTDSIREGWAAENLTALRGRHHPARRVSRQV